MKRIFTWLIVFISFSWMVFVSFSYISQYIDPYGKGVVSKAFYGQELNDIKDPNILANIQNSIQQSEQQRGITFSETEKKEFAKEKIKTIHRGVLSKNFVDGFMKFKSYFLILFIGYLCVVGFSFFLFEKKKMELEAKPYQIVILLLFFAYILFNTFFFTLNIDLSIHNILGQKIGEISFMDAQISFFSKTFFPIFTLSFLSLFSATLGIFVLKKMKLDTKDTLWHFIFSSASGFGLLILLLFSLGLFGLLQTYIVWGVLILLVGVLWKDAYYWVKKCFFHKISIRTEYFSLSTFFFFVFAVLFSIDFVELIRPIPIAWDDMNTYMNNAKLISGYHSLISGVLSYNWELVMSLGTILVNDVTTSLYLSFLGALFAILSLYAFVTRFIHPRVGIIAVVLYFVMPMVQHFSASDMKIDNALLFFTLSSLGAFMFWLKFSGEKIECCDTEKHIEKKVLSMSFCIQKIHALWATLFYLLIRSIVPFELWETGGIGGKILGFLIPNPDSFFTIKGVLMILLLLLTIAVVAVSLIYGKKEEQVCYEEDKKELESVSVRTFWDEYKYLILSGFLLGIALGVKITTLFSIFAFIVLIGYRYAGIIGALSLFFLQTSVLNYMGIFPVGDILIGFSKENISMGLLVVAIWGIAYIANKSLINAKKIFIAGIIFIVCMAVPYSPWLIRNTLQSKSLSIVGMMYGVNENKPKIDLESVGVNTSTCKASATTEELGRYIGYDTGIFRYLRLPWKLTMNTGVRGFYVIIGFLFLAFIPLLLLFMPQVWKSEKKRYLLIFAFSYYVFWMLKGSGVPWYGIGFFAIFIAFSLDLIYNHFSKIGFESEKNNNEEMWNFSWIAVLCMFVLGAFVSVHFLYLMVAAIMGIVFVFPDLVFKKFSYNFLKYLGIVVMLIFVYIMLLIKLDQFGVQELFKYSYGKSSREEVIDAMIPDYLGIGDLVEEGRKKYPDRHYLYRVGTFITYFIKDSDKVIAIEDAQVDTFSCINQEENHALTAKRLKDLGFRYMIVDLFTHTIEKTPGTLFKKFKKFISFVNDRKHVKLLYPRIPKNVQKQYPYMNFPEVIPEIQFDRLHQKIMYLYTDSKTGKPIIIHHKGYVFLELID